MRQYHNRKSSIGARYKGAAKGIGIGFGGRLFTPESLWSVADPGFWADLDATSAITYGSSPAVASVDCKGTLGDLAQADAAKQPDAVAFGSRLALDVAIGDGMILGSDLTTQRAFHDGTGSTISFVYTPDAITATRTLFSSADVDTSAGVKCTLATNGAITYSVYNTTGGTPYLTCTSAAGVIAPSVTALIRIVMSTAGAYVYVDGLLVASDASVAGAPTAGDATNLLKIGNLAAAYTAGAVGQIADVYSVAKAVSASEGALLDRLFADRHGIKLGTDTLTEAELETWTGLVSWVDPLDAVISYNTQPTKETWAGANWSGSGLGPYTHTPGATATLTSATLLTGNRYVVDWSVGSRTDGTVEKLFGTATAGGARSTNAAFTDEATANGTADAWSPTSPFDGAVTVSSDVNTSIASIPERVGGGAYAQATAANMPWVDSTTGAIRFDGTADVLTSNRAASTFSFLHTGNCELITVANIANTTANGYLFDTWSTDGVLLYQIAGTNRLKCLLRNDSGTFDLLESAPGSITPGTPQIYGMSILGSGAYLHVNTSVVDTEAFTADAGVGKTASLGSALAGAINETLAFSRTLSGSERYRLRVMLAAKHSITL